LFVIVRRRKKAFLYFVLFFFLTINILIKVSIFFFWLDVTESERNGTG
jgi:hypothetical protein